MKKKKSHHRSSRSGWDFTIRFTLFKYVFPRTHHNLSRMDSLNREEMRTLSAMCAGCKAYRCEDISGSHTSFWSFPGNMERTQPLSKAPWVLLTFWGAAVEAQMILKPLQFLLLLYEDTRKWLGSRINM